MNTTYCEDCVYLLDDGLCEYWDITAHNVANCENRCIPLTCLHEIKIKELLITWALITWLLLFGFGLVVGAYALIADLL